MTVCVATVFHWNYGKKDSPELGMAAIAASDRMITAGDIKYEPQQLKFAFMTTSVLVMIAGDYSIHSEALLATRKNIGSNVSAHPKDVALFYGTAIQAIKRRHAEDLYLAPLGLNTDSFIAQQRELSEGFIDRLTSQMQGFRGDDMEALVIGSDGTNVHLYLVDTRGTVSLLNDVGFGAIGSGAWHARSRLMQAGYVYTTGFAPALAATYVAKKSAEVAPGVGMATDMRLVTKLGIEPIMPKLFKKIEDVYQEYEKQRAESSQAAVDELQEFISSGAYKEEPDGEGEKGTGGGSQADGGASSQPR